MNQQIDSVLKRIWGFDDLRPLQREVIQSSLSGRDAVAVMPTGGGKSLCFQLPALVSGRLTVVVSPLIALMKDQVDALKTVGVRAAMLNSSLSEEECEKVRSDVVSGQVQILYLSPERLLLSPTLQMLKAADGGLGVARFAIDEAHCISAWGHDFRPEFRKLAKIRESFPEVPIQAFTATATPKVQRDIAIQLKLERPRRFVGTFDRPNLTYRIVAKDDAVRRTAEAVRRFPDEGVIVYCLSRKDTERIAGELVKIGIPCLAYHAGLPNEVRKKVSEDFASERANVIVATVAFGMGIDRANVRCVIHECLPKSMEGYQQETGRAGRDGLPSDCVLLYNYGDVIRLKRLLSDSEPELRSHHQNLLEEVRKFVVSHQCRHKSLSEYFGQEYLLSDEGCGACDVCLGGMKSLENSTEIGLKLLAALAELNGGKSFGIGYFVDVLIGANSKTVRERGGNTSQFYGSFRGEPSDRVTSWVHQIMDLGFIDVAEGMYSTISLSELGAQALYDQAEIVIVENTALQTNSKSKKEIPNMDSGLFETLRQWRKEVAVERSVPAYVIFHDATLMRIAAIRPSDKSGLKLISGVGERQFADFSDTIMKLVDDYCSQNSIERDCESVGNATVKRDKVKRVLYTDYFERGLSISTIAEQTGKSISTISTHLDQWIRERNIKDVSAWVSPEKVHEVELAMQTVGNEYLKPIFEHLNGKLSYEEIRIAKAALEEGDASRDSV